MDIRSNKDKMSIKELIPVTMDGKEVSMFDDRPYHTEGSESGGILYPKPYDEKIWLGQNLDIPK